MSTLERLAAALSDRYRIERELGQGGMATVYLAHDLRLGRPVAIKVVRPDFAAALGADRFLAEIRVTASLRHPNLMPLFEAGEAGGQLFYVMPYVDGETLRERLERGRQLPVDEAMGITSAIADALDYAHRNGIVHRDVKPENVLLAGGHAILTDFGIACALSAAGPVGGPRLTEVGLSLGTPPYMSPEQAMAEPELDGRSDLYSLAVVLFEALTGVPPYSGPSTRAILARQLTDPVPSLRALRGDVSEGLERALTRALAREPGDRFETLRAFTDALRTPDPKPPRARSIAVLPFLNMSADPENEHFADGITEDVISQLSKIRALQVISRTSVMPFKGRQHGLREIAERLRVATLVEGSVRRAGDRVRIVAQLIDATTDQHLWSDTFDRQLTDIFAIQTEVALQIATALEATLSLDERARLAKVPTNDVRAYQEYLQGRQCLIRYTEEGMRQAIVFFEQAIAIDPGYALAYAGIAMAYTDLGECGAVDPERAYPPAKAAAARALALDPDLAEAHSTRGLGMFVYDFDWIGAEAEFKRALELSPSNADTYDLYGRFCSALERFDEAIALQQRAHELDPLAHPVDIATAYLRAKRYDEALEAATRAIGFDQENARAHSTLGWAYFGKQRFAEGLAAMEHAVHLAPGNSLWLGQLGEAYALAGKIDLAERVLHDLEEAARHRFVAPYHLAYVYTGLGQQERAMDCLEEAFEQRAGSIYGIRGSFLFAPLRGNPRFTALLRRMNLV